MSTSLKKELKASNMYYHRPANELIFLTTKEHSATHTNPFKGKHHTEKSKRKMSESMKDKYFGENNPFYNKKHTEESRKKISAAHKNVPLSEEHKKKLSELNKGENNPMYGRHHTDESKRKNSEATTERNKGRHWYNNGKVNKFCYECPEGYEPGMLK